MVLHLVNKKQKFIWFVVILKITVVWFVILLKLKEQ